MDALCSAVVINGSARGEKGVTHRLLSSFAEGLHARSCKADAFVLRDLRLEHCASCLSCMTKTKGVCVIDDDMTAIYAALKRADALIVGTPLYTDTMSSRTKVFFDRCVACLQPYLEKDSDGHARHPPWWRVPRKIVLISTCALPEQSNFIPLEATISALSRNLRTDFAASLCVPGSIGLQMDLRLLEPRLDLFRRAGAEFAETGSVSAGLLAQINTPVLSEDAYFAQCRKYEEWCRRRLEQ